MKIAVKSLKRVIIVLQEDRPVRTPNEMIELIVSIARDDEDIRAVLMTGSRANPDCPVDIYQDFDVNDISGWKQN